MRACARVRAALHLLPPERASLGQSSLTTGGLAEDGRAAGADDDGLGVREDGGDVEAAGALNVHEEGAGGGHKSLWQRWKENFESVMDLGGRESAGMGMGDIP